MKRGEFQKKVELQQQRLEELYGKYCIYKPSNNLCQKSN